MSKTTVKNMESVDFGNLQITTTLKGGFDSTAEEHEKREITLHFDGFDQLDRETKETLLGELAGKLRIKVNQTDGELKGRPGVVDPETYVDMLDQNNCEFRFNVAELYEPTSRSKTPEQEMLSAAKKMLAAGTISEEKYQQFVEAARESAEAQR